MKGAEALLRTLVGGGVEVCFTNPGTSEMQFVAALDRVPSMRAVLVLFEGVATGAADAYARMADKPAATLLHLGPGLGNGLTNLHNARRAEVPIVNIVGEHATYHVKYDAPLTADIEGFARPVSAWICTTRSAQTIAADTAEAVRVARMSPGQIATLIAPADATWDESDGPAVVAAPPRPTPVSEAAVREAADALRSGEPAALLITGAALREPGLDLAGRIGARTGARLCTPTFVARLPRGAGRVAVERLPYFGEQVVEMLKGVRHLILLGTKPPVSFFAYPGMPSTLTPDGATVHILAAPTDDLTDALARLAEAVGAKEAGSVQALQRPDLPGGDLKPATIGQAIAALLPEHAIVVDEGNTSAQPAYNFTAGAPPHDWLMLTGGAIGDGIPMALGAAVACPDRKVVHLQADGSAAYTVQGLWSMAREHTNVTTVLYNNHSYRILQIEYGRTGSGQQPGPIANSVMSLRKPDIDWVNVAQGFGVQAARATTLTDFNRLLAAFMAEPGPNLVEAVI
jgi:acetolactate synthase-1/2/3 large subunit